MYVRDASGNVMSVYENVTPTGATPGFTQTEAHLYGSSRLGVDNVNRDVSSLLMFDINTYSTTFERGNKFFELSNHLGNVLVTVSDRVVQVQSTTVTTAVEYYQADVVTANDYYPFGMSMPGRTFSAGTAYRYGFNGKETSPEISSGAVSFEARIYDSRIGRLFTLDPRLDEIPYLSPYSFAANAPISTIDSEGEIPIIVTLIYLDEKGNEVGRFEVSRNITTVEEILTGIERTAMYVWGYNKMRIDEEGVFRHRYVSIWTIFEPYGVEGGLDNWDKHANNPNNNFFDNAMYTVYGPLVRNFGIEKLIIAGEGEDLRGNKYDNFSRFVNGLEGAEEFFTTIFTGGKAKISEILKSNITEAANKEMAKTVLDNALKLFKSHNSDEKLNTAAEILVRSTKLLIDNTDNYDVSFKTMFTLVLNVMQNVESVRGLQKVIDANGGILPIDYKEAVIQGAKTSCSDCGPYVEETITVIGKKSSKQ